MPAVARLWHDGWHEAHAEHVPHDLRVFRTLETFQKRAAALDDRTRVIGPTGAPLGMCEILNDELNQLYVASAGRGTGIAGTLLADGEAQLAASGVQRAHLFCLPENQHAARFYTHAGWTDTGVHPMTPPASGQSFKLSCIRFKKALFA